MDIEINFCQELLLTQLCYFNGLSPDIKNNIFKLRQNTYNLRNFHAFEYQNSASLLIFKESIKKLLLISC